MIELCCEYLSAVHLTVFYYHVMHVFQSESTLYSLPECWVTLCSKQVLYLKFKWQQQDLKPQPLSSKMNTQPFSQTDQSSDSLWNSYVTW